MGIDPTPNFSSPPHTPYSPLRSLKPPDQPTYYHFHIHIVNVALEPGVTQATGKAFGLENIISQLTSISAGDKDGVDVGMADVDLTYVLGEASELWTEVFLPLKQRKRV